VIGIAALHQSRPLLEGVEALEERARDLARRPGVEGAVLR
jgi:hypothetical protein